MRSPGIGVKAFVTAIERVTGSIWTPKRLDFGGRTDPTIAALILEDAGFSDPALVVPVLEALTQVYGELTDELRSAVAVLPGVSFVLDTLHAQGAVQTVVTGNVEPVARLKLAAADLLPRLDVELGGYGSDHEIRDELVRLALRRIEGTGAEIDASRVWVVGDTPRDLACARANNVRCLLVATGTFSLDELTALEPDLALPSLAEPDEFLAALQN